jgi:hypothetical protein
MLWMSHCWIYRGINDTEPEPRFIDQNVETENPVHQASSNPTTHSLDFSARCPMLPGKTSLWSLTSKYQIHDQTSAAMRKFRRLLTSRSRLLHSTLTKRLVGHLSRFDVTAETCQRGRGAPWLRPCWTPSSCFPHMEAIDTPNGPFRTKGPQFLPSMIG